MAECFCGCGSKVKFTRRAFNGTGRLVRIQLDAWEERADSIEAAGGRSASLERFLGRGREMDENLESIVHGGPVQLVYPQREITRWLNGSRQRLIAFDSGEVEVAVGGEDDEPATPPSPPPGAGAGEETGVPDEADEGPAPRLSPDARAARRAEIEAIRAEYEGGASGVVSCPECGAELPDQGAYVAHLAEEHA